MRLEYIHFSWRLFAIESIESISKEQMQQLHEMIDDEGNYSSISDLLFCQIIIDIFSLKKKRPSFFSLAPYV